MIAARLPKEFPKVIKGVVTIYRSPEGEYDPFALAWREGDRRKRRKFADFSEAKKEAESIADKINQGENAAFSLTNSDRSAYVNSRNMLDPLGIPLEFAVREYIEFSAGGIESKRQNIMRPNIRPA